MHKIVLLTQYYSPEVGAPQNRLFELAVGLKARGWDVSVVTAMPNYPDGKIFKEYRGRFCIKENIEGISIIRYWLYASNSKKTVPRILSMLSFSITSLFSLRFIKRTGVDFMLVESPPLTLGVSGVILTKISKIRLIFNVSDLWPLSARSLGYLSAGWLYRCLEHIESYVYKKAFICTGQSREIVDYISAKGAKKTYLFRNGVDPNRFNLSVNPRNCYHITLVYTGLLGVAQGILELCQAINFRELNTEFHIYGSGPDKDELNSYLKINPNQGIFYHGPVTREEIPKVLSSYTLALICLNKSIYGAVPSKIYESMAAGLPIIFSGDGEGKHIIEEYDLGWTSPPGDYQALSKLIGSLHLHRSDFTLKRKNCIESANKTFNRQEQINGLQNYLDGFLKI